MHDVTVLVIEDNIAMLSAVESALHGVCMPVLAKTGKSGVAIFKEHRPCVVVLDLGLPDVHGLEVLSLLKTIDPAVPVIILTAVDDTSVASKAVKAGAFAYLVKPVELRSLVTVIQEATEKIPIADGIILPSVITKDLFKKLDRAYAETDVVVVLGERGVGKEALSKAVHRLHYGSEHSLLVAKTASLLHGDILPKIKDRYSTICLRACASEKFSVLSSLDLRKLGRKIIVNIETPRREEQPGIEAELAISGICEAITMPPLRMRQSEAFPILCYWHQKLAPSKLLEMEAAEFYVEKLGEAGFPGNIDSIVALARRLTAG